MRTSQPLPPPLQSRPFTTREAYAHGVSRRRIVASDLVGLFHGIHARRDADDLSDLAAAYSRKMDAAQFFSHATAAFLWGLPLPLRMTRERVVHVGTTAAHPARGRRVVGHRYERRPNVVSRDGLAVTSPAETWRDLATVMSQRELVVVGDALVGRADPLCERDEVDEIVARSRGRRGAQRLRGAAAKVRSGVDSPMETILRLLLCEAGLPEPVVNRQYWADDGTYLGRADLSYPEQKVAIEYEGDGHRTDRVQFNRDIRRRERFESAGWSQVRVARDGVLRHSDETVWAVRRRLARS